MPKSDKEEPKREKVPTDNDEPTHVLSRTEKSFPSLTVERLESVAPSLAKLVTAKLLPKSLLSRIEK
jgi:hypothetical protein